MLLWAPLRAQRARRARRAAGPNAALLWLLLGALMGAARADEVTNLECTPASSSLAVSWTNPGDGTGKCRPSVSTDKSVYVELDPATTSYAYEGLPVRWELTVYVQFCCDDACGASETCSASNPALTAGIAPSPRELDRDDVFAVPFQVTGSYYRPVLYDWSGDGLLDLFLCLLSTVEYYVNVGTAAAPSYQSATLPSQLTTPLTGLNYPTLAFGNLFGNDEFDDLLIGHSTGLLAYSWQGGNSMFVANSSLTVLDSLCQAETHCTPAIVDADGDSSLDVIVGTDEGAYFVSGGTAAASAGCGTAGDGERRVVTAFDVDDDGDLDMIVGTESDGVLVCVDGTYDATLSALWTAAIGGTHSAIAIDVEASTALVGTTGSLQLLQLGTHPSVMPQAPVVQAFDGFANVSFVVPDDNGFEITAYVVTTSDEALTATVAASPAHRTWVRIPSAADYGLSVVVAAVNSRGTADYSPASSVVTTLVSVSVDEASDVLCEAADYGMAVSWSYDVGSAERFNVTIEGTGEFQTMDWTSFSYEAAFTNLENGRAYTARVQAIDEQDRVSVGVTCQATPAAQRSVVELPPPSWLPVASQIDNQVLSPAFVDVNSDGLADLVLAQELTNSGGWLVFLNTGNATHPDLTADGLTTYGSTSAARTSPAFCDDTITTTSNFIGKQNGYLVSVNSVELYDGTATSNNVVGVGTYASPSCTDLDGDGGTDMVIGNAGGEILQLQDLATRVQRADSFFPWTAPVRQGQPAISPDGLTLLMASWDRGVLAVPRSDLASAFPAPDLDEHTVVASDGAKTALAIVPPALWSGTAAVVIDAAQSVRWLVSAAHPDEVDGESIELEGGDGYLDVSWAPVEANGDALGLYYSVAVDGHAAVNTTETSLRYGGLTGQAYFYVHVTAVNGVGASHAVQSPYEGLVTSRPAEVVSLQCEGGDRNVWASWEPPAYNGGTEVTSYVTSLGSTVAVADGTEVEFADLASWETYTLTVTAQNSNGTGPSSTCEVERVVLRETAVRGSISPFFPSDEVPSLGLMSPVLYDMDDDGDLDLILGSLIDLQFYRFDSSSQLFELDTAALDLPFETGSESVVSPAVGDIDGDGDGDLLLATAGNELQYWKRDAGGDWVQHAPPEDSNDTAVHCVSVGDVNGDGRPDMVTSYDGDFWPRLFLNDNGELRFSRILTEIAAHEESSLTFGLDGDLFFGSTDPGNLLWYRNTHGNGSQYDLVDTSHWQPTNAYLQRVAWWPSQQGFLMGSAGSLLFYSMAGHADDVPAPSVTASPGYFNVTWEAAADFGAAVTAYTVVYGDGGANNVTVTDGRRWVALPDAGAGNVSVVSTNFAGDSYPSPATLAPSWIAPSAVPAAPSQVVCEPGDYSITVSWEFEGGDAEGFVLSFSSHSLPDVQLRASDRRYTVTELDNLVTYTMALTALNALGSSASSAACAAEPRAPLQLLDTGVPSWLPSVPYPLLSFGFGDLVDNDGVLDLLATNATDVLLFANVGSNEAPEFVHAEGEDVPDYSTVPNPLVLVTDLDCAGSAADVVIGEWNAVGARVLFFKNNGLASPVWESMTSPTATVPLAAYPSRGSSEQTCGSELLVGHVSGLARYASNGDLDIEADWDPLPYLYAAADWGNGLVVGTLLSLQESVDFEQPQDVEGLTSHQFARPRSVADFAGVDTGILVGYSDTDAHWLVYAGHPDEVLEFTAVAGHSWAELSWTAGSDNAASVTEFTVTVSPGALVTTVDGEADSVIISTGVAGGNEYTFSIVAHNAVGESKAVASDTVLILTTPDAPTEVVCDGGDRTIGVSWSAPEFNSDSVEAYVLTTALKGDEEIVVGKDQYFAEITDFDHWVDTAEVFVVALDEDGVAGPSASCIATRVVPRLTPVELDNRDSIFAEPLDLGSGRLFTASAMLTGELVLTSIIPSPQVFALDGDDKWGLTGELPIDGQHDEWGPSVTQLDDTHIVVTSYFHPGSVDRFIYEYELNATTGGWDLLPPLSFFNASRLYDDSTFNGGFVRLARLDNETAVMGHDWLSFYAFDAARQQWAWTHDLLDGEDEVLLDQLSPMAFDVDADGDTDVVVFGDKLWHLDVGATDDVTVVLNTEQGWVQDAGNAHWSNLKLAVQPSGAYLPALEQLVVASDYGFQSFQLVGHPGGVAAPVVEAHAGYFSLSWDAAEGYGTPVTSYVVHDSAGGTWDAGASTTLAIAGLTDGQEYVFNVTATHEGGSSLPSAYSAPVAFQAGGGEEVTPPLNVVCEAGDYSVQVSFEASSSPLVTAYFYFQGEEEEEEEEVEVGAFQVGDVPNNEPCLVTVTAVSASGASAQANCSATPFAMASPGLVLGPGGWLPVNDSAFWLDGKTVLSDVSGDGARDVVVLSPTQGLMWIENSGSDDEPEFETNPRVLELSDQYNSGGDDFVVCDLVGNDGLDDVVIFREWEALDLYVNEGGGVFAAPVDLGYILPYYLGGACFDFDNDSDLDIVWASFGGDLIWFENLSPLVEFEKRGKSEVPIWSDVSLTYGPWTIGIAGSDFLLTTHSFPAYSFRAKSPDFASVSFDVNMPADTLGVMKLSGVQSFAGAETAMIGSDDSGSLFWFIDAAHADEVTNVTLVAGHSYLDVSWAPPANDNGLDVSSYVVTLLPSSAASLVVNDTTSARFTGLENGEAYSVSVQAVNLAGASKEVESAAATILATPDVPTNVQCAGHQYEIDVSWDLPEFNTDGITGFAVNDLEELVLATNVTLVDVDHWTELTIAVSAVNEFGAGPAATCVATRVVPRLTPVLGDRDSVFVGGFETIGHNYHPQLVDWDGDGDEDLFLFGHTSNGAFSRQYFAYSLADGFELQGALPFEVPESFAAVSSAFGDFDQDGFLDLIGCESSLAASGLQLYLGNDTHMARSPLLPFLPNGTLAFCHVDTADVDGNGVVDLLVSYSSDSLLVLNLSTTTTTTTVFDSSLVGVGVASFTSYWGSVDILLGGLEPLLRLEGTGAGTWVYKEETMPSTGAHSSAVVVPGHYGILVGSKGSLAWYDLAGNPDAVAAPSARAMDGFVNVSWAASDDYGAAVTRYTVSSSSSSSGAWETDGELWVAVAGLTPGSEHEFAVTATNAAGSSLPSAASAPVTIPSASSPPEAPQWVACEAGDYSIAVTWAASSSATSYLISPFDIEVTAATNATITGLDNYVETTVSVVAVNAAGESAEVQCSATPHVELSYQLVQELSWFEGESSASPAFGDFDMDGDNDLAVMVAELPTVMVFLNEDGAFDRDRNETIELTGHLGYHFYPAFGDADSDGVVDIVVGNNRGELVLIPGGGEPDYAFFDAVPTSGDLAPQFGDIDGDGSQELTLSSVGGEVFVPFEDYPLPWVSPSTDLRVCFPSPSTSEMIVGTFDSGMLSSASFAEEPTTLLPLVVPDGNFRLQPACADSTLVVGTHTGMLLWYELGGRAAEVTDVVMVDFKDGTATLTWTAPADTGSTVTLYTIKEESSGRSINATEPPVLFSGLGAEFTTDLRFTVTALNAIGSSASSYPAVLGEVGVSATREGRGVAWNVSSFVEDDALIESVVVEETTCGASNRTTAAGSTSGEWEFPAEDLCCAESVFRVTVTLVGQSSSPLVAETAAVVPWGLCPVVCSQAVSEWVDPTGVDPFRVECNGSWTLIAEDLSAERVAALAAWSTLSTGTAMLTDTLDTAFNRTADEFMPRAVNVSLDFAVDTNPTAAFVEYLLDNGTTWSSDPPHDAAQGWHTLQARAALAWHDPDPSPAEFSFEQDYEFPVASISARPAAFANTPVSTFALAATEDAVVFFYCVDSNCSYVATAESESTPPATVMTAGVDTPLTSLPATFFFEIEAGTSGIDVSVDGGTWTPAASPINEISLSSSSLQEDGWHSVRFRAKDSLGTYDESPVVVAFRLDTSAEGVVEEEPDTFFSVAPPSVTASRTAVLVFNSSVETAASFHYSLDFGGTWTLLETEGDRLVLDDLEDGFYSVLGRATGATLSDPTPAVSVWQVAPAPVATLVLAPPVAPELSPFLYEAFAVEVTGGSGCSSPYELFLGEGDSQLAVESGVADEDGVIIVGPLDFAVHTLVVSPECEQAANVLTHTWEATAGSAQEVTVNVVGEGVHFATVSATDRAGNEGPVVSYNWTLDTVAPVTSLAGVPAVVVVDSFDLDPLLGCDDASACAFSLWLDDVAVTSCCQNLTQGSHTLEAQAVDAAGNVDETTETVVFIVDSLPPALEWAAVNGLLTRDPTFSASCVDAVSLCFLSWDLDGSPDVAGNVERLQLADLAEGDHVLEVHATDEASNRVSATVEFTVDTVEPQTYVVAGPVASVVNVTSVDIVGNCSDNHPGCVVNSSHPLSQEGLADGAYSVTVFAVDAAGNVDSAPEVVAWVVDTVAPNVTVANRTYNAAGDGVAIGLRCSEPSCRYSRDLWVSGDNEEVVWEVSAVDPAGNAGAPVATTLVFDSIPPTVAFVSVPEPFGRQQLFTGIEFSATDTNLEGCNCSLWRSDSSASSVALECAPGVPFSIDLGAGTQETEAVLDVTCYDVRDHEGRANATWQVDRLAPAVAITNPLSNATLRNELEWTMEFEVSDSSPISCFLSLGESFSSSSSSSCASPWVVQLAEGADHQGEYLFLVTVVDAADNEASANVTLMLDSIAPVLMFDAVPAAASTETTAEFEFRCVLEEDACGGSVVTDDDCSFSCSLSSGEAWDPATSPLDTGALDAGDYVFECTARDAAGNEATESYAWAISADDVYATFETVPASPFGLSEFEFEIAAPQPGLELQWRLNAGEWATVGNASSSSSATATTAFVLVDLDSSDFGEMVMEIRVLGFPDATTTFGWEYSQCADVDEVQFIDDSTGLLSCYPCREGDAQCALNGKLADGFWLPPGGWSSPYKCVTPEACPGASRCASAEAACTADLCLDGSEGVLCGVCSEGYAKNLQGVCQFCASTSGATATVVLGTVLGVLLLFVAALVVRRSLDVSGTARTVATVKIMVNYFLMMSILKDFKLDWGSLLTEVFTWVGVAGGAALSDVHVVNCAFPVSIWQEFLFYFLVPAFLIGGPAAAIVASATVVRLKLWRAGKPQPKNVILWGVKPSFLYRQALMVLSYFAYPLVITATFRVMHCVAVEGEYWLVDDLGKECAGSPYDSYRLVALLFMVVVAPGVPLALGSYMRKYKTAMQHQQKARQQFFFFFGEFKPEWYWWEMTVMARKVAMGAIAVLLSNNKQNMQVYAGTWLLLFCFVAHILCQPHVDGVQRKLEAASLSAVLASLLLGQALAFANLKEWQIDFFRMSVLCINLVVMEGMCVVLGREIYKEITQRAATIRGRAATLALAVDSAASSPTFAGVDKGLELTPMSNPMLPHLAATGGQPSSPQAGPQGGRGRGGGQRSSPQAAPQGGSSGPRRAGGRGGGQLSSPQAGPQGGSSGLRRAGGRGGGTPAEPGRGRGRGRGDGGGRGRGDGGGRGRGRGGRARGEGGRGRGPPPSVK